MNASQKENPHIGIPEAARLLGVSNHALERWIRQGAIPYRRVHGEIVFNHARLREWADSHNMTWMESEPISKPSSVESMSLANAIQRGGVYTGIEGDDVNSVLESAVQIIDFPEEVEREQLLKKLLERETLASTGIGHGAAVPHPRTPLKPAFESPTIAVCFLDTPINYNAIDGEPVSVLFMMLSPSTKVHLQMLARLGFCLREKTFIEFLRHKPDMDSLCQRVEKMESKMGTTKRV